MQSKPATENNPRGKYLRRLFFKKVRSYAFYLKEQNFIIQKNSIFSPRIQNNLVNKTKEILCSAYHFENSFDNKSQQAARKLFREILGSMIFRSNIIKRFYDKPRGYPGDYLVFEHFYDSKAISRGIGFYLDLAVLHHPVTIGMLERKALIKKLILKYINETKQRPVSVLNIGSGAAREIRELIDEGKLKSRINFVLEDQDEEGFDYFRTHAKAIPGRLRFTFKRQNVLESFGFRRGKSCGKRYDIVYSVGISDYLTDNLFGFFLQHSFSQLKTGGFLIVACCNLRSKQCYTALKWFGEWKLHLRSSAEVRNILLRYLGKHNVRFYWPKSRVAFFVVLQKII
ncbi:MAG: hypothetical protein MIO92_11725 [Methanosarcinaceae archaeon]|nr:hypothetical protein [Methanosarcinaceae archaeon]